jgi:hypothetical protein
MNDPKPIRPGQEPEEPKPERVPMNAGSWVLLIGALVIFGGPLAVWLYRLAFGL